MSKGNPKIKFLFCVLFLLSVSLTAGALFELPVPGITPDSIYYPLDTLAEKIVLFFAFNPEKKIEKSMQYAEEKLAEMDKMVSEGKIKMAEKALRNYQNYTAVCAGQVRLIEYEEDKSLRAESIAERILEYENLILNNWQDESQAREENRETLQNTINASRQRVEDLLSLMPEAQQNNVKQQQDEINAGIQEQQAQEEVPEEENATGTEASPAEGSQEAQSGFTAEEQAHLTACRFIESSDIFSLVKCYKEMGRSFANLELCQSSGDITCIASCYGGAAAAVGSSELCNQFSLIPSEGASTIMLSACYGSFAQLNKNPLLCQQAPTDKSVIGCYLLFAGLEGNTDVCDYIGQGKEGCYLVVASEEEDLSICKKIDEEEWKALCENTVNQGVEGKKELCKVGESLGLFSESDCLEQLFKQ